MTLPTTDTRDWYLVRVLAVEQNVRYLEYMAPTGTFTRVSPCAHAPVPGLTWMEAHQLRFRIQSAPEWTRFTMMFLHQSPELST